MIGRGYVGEKLFPSCYKQVLEKCLSPYGRSAIGTLVAQLAYQYRVLYRFWDIANLLIRSKKKFKMGYYFIKNKNKLIFLR